MGAMALADKPYEKQRVGELQVVWSLSTKLSLHPSLQYTSRRWSSTGGLFKAMVPLQGGRTDSESD